MKRIQWIVMLLMVFILVAVAPAMAAETTKTLTFEWEQETVDLPYLAKWSLYWSDTSGSGYVKVADVPYTGGAGPTMTTDQALLVAGAPGSSVTKYFVLTAVSKNGMESAWSNEINDTFVPPYPNVTVPFNLRIRVVIP